METSFGPRRPADPVARRPRTSYPPRPRRRLRRDLADRWDLLVVIALGGALGSLGRWGVAEISPHSPDRLAWGTWIVNVTGSLLLGVLMVFVIDVWPPTRYVRPFLGVGVLGGFTTYSTYMLEVRDLIAEDEPARAAGYVFGTLVVGLLAVWVGMVIARVTVALTRRRHERALVRRGFDHESTRRGS